jgi:hypothetical protein
VRFLTARCRHRLPLLLAGGVEGFIHPVSDWMDEVIVRGFFAALAYMICVCTIAISDMSWLL